MLAVRRERRRRRVEASGNTRRDEGRGTGRDREEAARPRGLCGHAQPAPRNVELRDIDVVRPRIRETEGPIRVDRRPGVEAVPSAVRHEDVVRPGCELVEAGRVVAIDPPLGEERCPVRRDRVANAASVVSVPRAAARIHWLRPCDEHGARRWGQRRAPPDRERRAAEGGAAVGAVHRAASVVDEGGPVRVVIDRPFQRPLRDFPRLRDRPPRLAPVGERQRDGERLASVRVRRIRRLVPDVLRDRVMLERGGRVRGNAEVALVLVGLPRDVDVDGVVVSLRPDLPLKERPEQAARPDRLVVGVEPDEPRIGGGGSIQNARQGGTRITAGPFAADAAAPSQRAPAVRAPVRACRALRRHVQEDRDRSRRSQRAVRRGDVGQTAERPGGREEPGGGADLPQLAAVDRPHGRHRRAVQGGRELERGDGLPGDDVQDLVVR